MDKRLEAWLAARLGPLLGHLAHWLACLLALVVGGLGLALMLGTLAHPGPP